MLDYGLRRQKARAEYQIAAWREATEGRQNRERLAGNMLLALSGPEDRSSSRTMKSEEVRKISPWRFCVAPMMEWTDRHCRFFHRLLTRRALLYTEMLTTGAVLHGDRARLLRYDPAEHPLALQLGGSDPRALAACARIGADLGFDEINLNVGCPSDRVQEGRFGACLMASRRSWPSACRDEGGGVDPRHRKMPHGRRRPGSGRGARTLASAVERPAPTPSSCMPARPGSKACRRRRTARFRRSTMRASSG